jgi:hypothetical protein
MDNPQLWTDLSHDHLHGRSIVDLCLSGIQLLCLDRHELIAECVEQMRLAKVGIVAPDQLDEDRADLRHGG